MLLTHRIRELALQCGASASSLKVSYEVYGELNAERSNAILVPTWFAYGGSIRDWVIGPERALDTRRHCVILMHSLGGGCSSSASNDSQLMTAGEPISISVYDQVRAQAAVLQHLGIGRLCAVVGYGSASTQALQWGCLWPQMVERVVAIGGTPRMSAQSRQVLANVEAMLSGSDGQPNAAEAYVRTVVPHERDRDEGFGELIRASIMKSAPCDLIAQLRTWHTSDISSNPLFRGNIGAALRSIPASTLVISADGDPFGSGSSGRDAWREIPSVHERTLYSRRGHSALGPSASEEDLGMLNTLLISLMGKRNRRSVAVRLLAHAFA